jgi:sulfur carrier protein
MTLLINGRSREFAGLAPGDPVAKLLEALDLKADRVAVEHNGEIVRRENWAAVALAEGDKLEIVHFVGGGAG